MKQIKVNPKNGWAHATRDEVQKSCANMMGERHCITPNAIYDKFTEMNIYLPSIMSYFMGSKTTENNCYLFDALMNKEPAHFWELIGNNYEKYKA